MKTIKQIAEILGVNKETVRRETAALERQLERIVAVKCGGVINIDDDDVDIIISTIQRRQAKKQTAAHTTAKTAAENNKLALSAALMRQYESQIAAQKEEIVFLREMLATKEAAAQAKLLPEQSFDEWAGEILAAANTPSGYKIKFVRTVKDELIDCVRASNRLNELRDMPLLDRFKWAANPKK